MPREASVGHHRDQQGEPEGTRAQGGAAGRRGGAHPARRPAARRGASGKTRDRGQACGSASARRGAGRQSGRLRGTRPVARRRTGGLCRADRHRPREDDRRHGRAHAAPASLLCWSDGGGRRRSCHGGRCGKPDAAGDRGRLDHHRPGARHRHAVELLPDARAGCRRRPQDLYLCRLRHQRRAQRPGAGRHRHRLGGERAGPDRRAAGSALVVLHPWQRQPPTCRQGARGVGDRAKAAARSCHRRRAAGRRRGFCRSLPPRRCKAWAR